MIRIPSSNIMGWAALFAAANFGIKGAYFLFVLGLAAKLTSSDYATFGMLYALQGAISTFSVVGLQELAAARLARFNSPQRRIVLYRQLTGVFLLTLLMTVLVFGSMGSVLVTLDVELPLVISALIVGSALGYVTLSATFLRFENEYGSSLKLTTFFPLVILIGSVFGAFSDDRLTGIYVCSAVSAVAGMAIMLLRGSIRIVPAFKLRYCIEVLNKIWPFVIIALLGWLSGYGMNFGISAIFERTEVATFKILFTLSSVQQIVASSVNSAWAPRFYHLFSNSPATVVEATNYRIFGVLAVTLGVVGFMLVASLPWFASFIGGNLTLYGSSRIELAMLLSAYIICIGWWQGQNYYHVAGYGLQLMHLSTVSGGLGLVGWILLMLAFGHTGIYMGFFMQMALKTALIQVEGSKHWNLRLPWAAITAGVALVFAGILVPEPSLRGGGGL